MVAAHVVVRLLKAQDLMKRLINVENALEDRTEAHDDTRLHFMDQWERNFDSEGSIYGAWAPLTERTLAERAALGFSSGPVLVRNGSLRLHFLDQVQAANVSSTATMWDFQSGNPPYMFAHHFGVNKIPSRVLWDINGADEQDVWEIFDDYVDDVIARYF